MVALVTKKRKQIRISPKDHGKRMSLDDFDRAIAPEGALYELNKGIIEVSDIPKLRHGQIVRFLRKILDRFDDDNPGLVQYSGGGTDAKVLVETLESERHPDWAVYFRAAPNDDQPWSDWVPELVIEVVSESSTKRDYEEKPPEYLALGISEYWIVDPLKQIITIKTRWRGIWKDTVFKPGQKYESRLLPGLKLDVRKILAAGK